MKDYTNYHTQSNEKIKHDGDKIFNLQENGYDGVKGSIDEIDYRFIIQRHVIQSDGSEFRNINKIMCKSNINLNLGSIVVDKDRNKKYIVTSDVNNNGFYKDAELSECSCNLKFYNKKSILCEVHCISEKATGFTLDENKSFSLLEGNLNIKIQFNTNTKDIYEGQRFIINNYVYRVTGIDDVTGIDINKNGYLILKLEKVEEDYRDDFVNGIAWNDRTVLNNYKVVILNGNSVAINKNQELKIDVQVLNNNNIVSPLPELIFTSSDLNICSVDTIGKIVGIGNGTCNITVSLKSDLSITSTINVKVQDVIVDNYSIEFINNITQLKLGKTDTIGIKVLNNGIEVNKNVSFNIINEDGSNNQYATIESVSGNSVVVKATSNTNYRNKYFYLRCNLVDDVNVYKEIKIKIASLI